jgi:hypothetical protein
LLETQGQYREKAHKASINEDDDEEDQARMMMRTRPSWPPMVLHWAWEVRLGSKVSLEIVYEVHG